MDPSRKFFLRLVTVMLEENYAQGNRKKLSFRTSYKLLMRNNETPKGSEFSLGLMYLTTYRIKMISFTLIIITVLVLTFQIHSRVNNCSLSYSII